MENTLIVSSIDTSPVIDAITEEANAILSGVISSPLSSFTVTQLGNFPYYWQDPSYLKFNANTYGWINSNLAADTRPIELDQLFTNIYINALSKVAFKLSKDDQSMLTQAQQNATNQQLSLLNKWAEVYGSIPEKTQTQQPIDIIMSTIANSWAYPATNLNAIQQSKNLNQLLNNTPASGKPILPVLANYLNAIGSSISLQNAVTMNTGYLNQALTNVQSPTVANGGLATNNGLVQPAYAVNTQLSDILNGLSSDSSITINMTIRRSSESEYSISINGGASYSISVGDLFTLSAGSYSTYFQDVIATSSNSVEISMKFTGVTMVNFGPTAFSFSTLLNWYWMKPITDAILNGKKDVSGFVFSPDPQIDFSENGPFGFLTGVAISNYPSVTITVVSNNYDSIATTITQSASVGLSFLGISLGGSGNYYSHSAESNSSMSSVTITLDPPPSLIAGQSTSSVGWVLGVQTNYPAANSQS